MARRRRFRVRADAGRGPRVSLEWLGFTDAGISAGLDTTTSFELIPPASADSVVVADFTVLRVVGNIALSNQSAVTSNSAVGMQLGVRSVGRDQVIDETFDPLSADTDDLDNKVMWQWIAATPGPAVVAADLDLISLIIPVDIKVKRKMNKRDSLVLTCKAATTARKEVSCNLRVLVRQY